jgi:hypothetical protein
MEQLYETSFVFRPLNFIILEYPINNSLLSK